MTNKEKDKYRKSKYGNGLSKESVKAEYENMNNHRFFY
jgi:hypothetical protein